MKEPLPKTIVISALLETKRRLEVLLLRGDLASDDHDEQVTRNWLARVKTALRQARRLRNPPRTVNCS